MQAKDRKTVWEHTYELIERLRICLVALVVVTAIVAFVPSSIFYLDIPSSELNATRQSGWLSEYFYPTIVTYVFYRIKTDILPPGLTLYFGSFYDLILIYFVVSLILGSIISSPVLAYEFYRFVNPALTSKERRMMVYFILSSTGLFMFGSVMAYLLIIPATFQVFLYMGRLMPGIEPLFTARSFIEFTGLMIVASGLCFTFPIFTTIAVQAGLIGVESLKSGRRYALVVILFFTAIITPDPTPVSMTILSLPMYLLYEVSIFVAKRIERGRREE